MKLEWAGSLAAQLARGDISCETLAQLGVPEPAKARGELLEAAHAPDLRDHVVRWGAPLLATPRPGFGARVLAEIARRYQQTRRAPPPPDCLAATATVVGSSEFLARLLLRHPHWAEQLRGELPEPPRSEPVDPDWTSIRIAKYQGLLRIAARDLLGRPFEASLSELSELADRCLRAGVARAYHGSPGPEPVVYALGKLGGAELNFSSDVDLVVLYEAGAPENELEQNREIARVLRELKRNFEAPSEDGFAYRVDFDLRPEGRSGALANSVDAALRYYETFGAEWERQALIRLRHVAGPAGIAAHFEAGITPFVFRRGIDPQAIRNVRDMKVRIEQERRRARRDLAHDIKEGPGGIRDVEFFVQALQLFYGGHHESIRTGNVLLALERLADTGLLPGEVAGALREGYLWLRRAEHAVQLPEERQTQRFPREATAQLALARRMGYCDETGARARDRLLDDWTRVRSEVRYHFDQLVLEEDGG